MDINAAKRVGQILGTVKALAVEYCQLTGKPLGATGEIAEYAVAKLLGLELAPPPTQGYDAVRRTEIGTELLQIKARAFSWENRKSQKLGRFKTEGPCDFMLMVLLDNGTLEPKQIWEAPFSAVLARLMVEGSKAGTRDHGAHRSIEAGRLRAPLA